MTQIFDSPQARLKPDSQGARLYGNVDNVLELAFDNGTNYRIPVAVPTMLFTYMREVMKAPIDAEVSMAIDEHEGRFVFSLLVSADGKEDLYDFWSYSALELPKFLLDEDNWIV